ncbi:DRTGG domain-containing protein [Lapidilactobacillus gannanensis]|jgi:predicted transcriptional regulator|uniref:DRTGG domain-containing protein n=1 Tax=Lapidilactobacillus gannanensis TaxID=2486002 RepID=A0ABW4BKW0_9LACO|nr:DRTGG domain-containing protein [Lapidilactobacillus gannanensis]MCH4056515.1 CBS domain-containing protein [Lactobacillaceae bacterium]
MATKHEEIIHYLETLPIGQKVSVRSIAHNLKVSEGTAYRAIKSAEANGLVATIERVGTVRIEKERPKKIEELSFADILDLINGRVLGGTQGLKKTLNKFVIGAMTEEAMIPYISPMSLVIVGNRSGAQRIALEHGAAVLITGGFDAVASNTALADQAKLPLISTNYDTYTVASLINRELSNKNIKQDILLVNDVFEPLEQIQVLRQSQRVADYLALRRQTNKSRFAVVTDKGRLVGVITYRDVQNLSEGTSLDKAMVKSPITVTRHTSLANAIHLLMSNAIDILPVVDHNFDLIGVVNRGDVQNHDLPAPKTGTWTLTAQIGEALFVDPQKVVSQDSDFPDWHAMVTPQMANEQGTLAVGVLTELLTLTATRSLRRYQQKVSMVDQMNLYYWRLVQLDHELTIHLDVVNANRRRTTFDINVYSDHLLVAKAIVGCQVIEEI